MCVIVLVQLQGCCVICFGFCLLFVAVSRPLKVGLGGVFWEGLFWVGFWVWGLFCGLVGAR